MKKKESKSETEKKREKGKETVGEKSKKPFLSGKRNRKEEKRKEFMLVSHREVRRVLLAKREPLFTTFIDMFLHVFPSITIVPTNVFPKDVPHKLPPFKGKEHHMDLTLGATLPNGETYKMNIGEAKEIQKQVAKLIKTSWVRESMSLCAMPIILVMEGFELGIHGKQTFDLYIPRCNMSPKNACVIVPRNPLPCANGLLPTTFIISLHVNRKLFELYGVLQH
ncbi:hypothetical protein CR513_19328, partial [Mucuna pruriens]